MAATPDPEAGQLLLALRIATYRLAADLQFSEPKGESRLRMQRALADLENDLKEDAGEFYVRGQIPDLTVMLDGASTNHRRSFLLEAVAADPFAPFWFEMTRKRVGELNEAIKRLAVQSLDLTVEDAEVITWAWREVVNKEAKAAKEPKKLQDYLVMGASAAALAGMAVAAGPLIAAAMPAAAGLSGAAAVSAGMAQLGFGSIAAGGLGMTGGLWMLGLGGGVAGAMGGAVGNAVHDLIRNPGTTDLVRLELRKLLVSAVLAQTPGWLTGTPSVYSQAVDVIYDEVAETLKLEEARNDPNAPRITDLRTLLRSADFVAGELSAMKFAHDAEE